MSEFAFDGLGTHPHIHPRHLSEGQDEKVLAVFVFGLFLALHIRFAWHFCLAGSGQVDSGKGFGDEGLRRKFLKRWQCLGTFFRELCFCSTWSARHYHRGVLGGGGVPGGEGGWGVLGTLE